MALHFQYINTLGAVKLCCHLNKCKELTMLVLVNYVHSENILNVETWSNSSDTRQGNNSVSILRIVFAF